MPLPIHETILAEERRVRVVAMYTAGETMQAIATAEGVNVSTISRDIARAREAWRKANNAAIEIWKDIQLARIDLIESSATASYERSLAESKKTTASRRTDEDGAVDLTKVEKEERAGDSKFLRIMLDCVAERCKILGLYEPKRTDITSGGQIVKVIGGMNIEDI